MFLTFFQKLFGGLVLLAFVAMPAPAQTVTASNESGSLARYVDQVNGLTADEAVRLALANNDELAAERRELEAARSLVRQARLRPNPSLEVTGARQIGGGDNNLIVQGMLPLELGGRRTARIRAAEREIAVRESTVADRERMLAAEVRRQFGEALAQTLKLKFTEELLGTALQGFRLVQARVEQGKTAPLEENMTLVELNRLRSLREVEEGRTRIAMLELRTLLGMPPEEPVRLRGNFDNLIAPVPSLADATDIALQNRPDLAVLRATEELAAAQIETARAEGRFDASLMAGYERMNFGFPVSGFDAAGQLRPVHMMSHMVMFGVTMELPIRNRNQGAIEAALQMREAAQKRREFAELVVRREVAAALTRYESAARALEIFRVGVRGLAATNLEVVRRTYELGARTLLDYIAEERRFIELENAFIDAQLAVYLARIEILRATAAPELLAK